MINASTFLKYNSSAPRYTSYPPANWFREVSSDFDYSKPVVDSNSTGPELNSIYFHIPFCPHQCLYCGCNTEINAQANLIRDYFSALELELFRIIRLLEKRKPIAQIHFGGGTPNAVPTFYLKNLIDIVKQNFDFISAAEIAIECDPALISERKLREIKEAGFNRVSFGIQDFNLDVLKAVERRASAIPVRELIKQCHDLGFSGVNIDLIYGLPLQTLESFSETIREACACQPDRIALFSYAHIPWVKGFQTKLENYPMPDPLTKVELFLLATDQLQSVGYRRIGMDHFALAHDELAKALTQKKLHRNFQGYASQNTTGQVYAFGCSAITQTEVFYAQNIKDTKSYIKAIRGGRWPLERYLEVSDEERIIREAITSLMCNNFLSLIDVAKRTSTSLELVHTILESGFDKLRHLPDKDLIEVGDDTLRVTEKGSMIIRYLAMQLDPLMDDSKNQETYSKTL